MAARLPVPAAILQQHTVILGKTRSGKSSVMRLLVESLLDRQEPVCIIDPKGDHWGIKLAADGKRPGYPVVIFGGEHADIPITEHAGASVAELFATGNRPCLIDLGGWMVQPRTRFWIDFASALFRCTKGTRWLAVDEVHNFAPKGKIFDPDAGKALHWMNRLASEGLGKGLALIFASQRPQKVHNDTLTSAETLIAMRVLHPSDRGAVADWIKGCGDASGDTVLASLAQLARGEGWVWSPEIGFGPTRVAFPLFRTYDSFRAQSVAETKRLTGWAEVDLDDVRARFADAIAEAAANDPATLKRTIADLRRQLAARPQPAPLVTRPPLVKAPVAGRLVTAIDRLDAVGLRLAEAAEAVRTAAHGIRVTIDTYEKGSGHYGVPPSARPDRARSRPDPVPAPPGAGSVAAHVSRSGLPASGGSGDRGARGEPAVRGGKFREMLIALAQAARPLTEAQVAVRANMAVSGTFDTYLGRMRKAGWVTGTRHALAITRDGLAALGPYEPLPRGGALRGYWLHRVGNGKIRNMLAALIDVWPVAVAEADLATRAGMAVSGTFDTYLGRLRKLSLVEGTRHALKATDELFEE